MHISFSTDFPRLSHKYSFSYCKTTYSFSSLVTFQNHLITFKYVNSILMFFLQILMSVNKDQMDVIITVLILLEAIIVLVWMDMNWNQIIIPVQVCNYIHMCIGYYFFAYKKHIMYSYYQI